MDALTRRSITKSPPIKQLRAILQMLYTSRTARHPIYNVDREQRALITEFGHDSAGSSSLIHLCSDESADPPGIFQLFSDETAASSTLVQLFSDESADSSSFGNARSADPDFEHNFESGGNSLKTRSSAAIIELKVAAGGGGTGNRSFNSYDLDPGGGGVFGKGGCSSSA